MARELIERAYWALTMNALEPVSEEETYPQDDINELVDELREFIDG